MPAYPVIMPKLGVYTEDVLLTAWVAPEGARVEVGDIVFELETDKTTAEVEAEAAGWLHRLVAAGEKVPIGGRVAVIAPTLEAYEQLAQAIADPGGDTDAVIVGSPEASPVRGSSNGPTALAPARPAPVDRATGSRPPISPRARALLRSLGIPAEEAAQIVGSGAGGRIVDTDVAAWAEARSAPQPAAVEAAQDRVSVMRSIPLRGRRALIASRMVSSLQTAAQLTSVLELDVAPLVELRAAVNGAGAEPRLGVASIVAKLVAEALKEHPLLNARVAESEIELLAEINLAIAVDTADGLVAPVVHGADRLSLEETNARVADLAARARAGSLAPADLEGGTFTVSNGGIHAVDLTTAILNPPQTGILWIGRIRERAVVVDGAIVARPTMQACLTYDHRAVDGAPAAAFLATLEALVAGLPGSVR